MARSLSPTNLLSNSGPFTLMKLVPAGGGGGVRSSAFQGAAACRTTFVRDSFGQESFAATRGAVSVVQ